MLELEIDRCAENSIADMSEDEMYDRVFSALVETEKRDLISATMEMSYFWGMHDAIKRMMVAYTLHSPEVLSFPIKGIMELEDSQIGVPDEVVKILERNGYYVDFEYTPLTEVTVNVLVQSANSEGHESQDEWDAFFVMDTLVKAIKKEIAVVEELGLVEPPPWDGA